MEHTSSGLGDLGFVLRIVTGAVEEAGELLVAEAARASPRGKGSKAVVDREIEDLLCARLEAAFPGVAIQAEEKRPGTGASGPLFVIDPHDGTADFLSGHRETSISVALVDGSRLRLGVVFAPVPSELTGEGLLAAWAEGEELTLNHAPAVARARAPVARLLLSRGAPPDLLAFYRELLGDVQLVPCASVATRLLLVAVGRADAAVAFKQFAPWDVAGGHALLRGAGGDLLSGDGRPIAWAGGRLAGRRPPGFLGVTDQLFGRGLAERLRPLAGFAGEKSPGLYRTLAGCSYTAAVDWRKEQELPALRAPREDDLSPLALDSWVPIVGLGRYTGTRSAAIRAERDRLFGEGRWAQGWAFEGRVVARREALGLYEEAYVEHLRTNPDELDWICRTASEVYDNAVSNLASGFDYRLQEAASTHLQDVAVRRAVVRLGRRLEGDHLVEIRAQTSEGYHLNPGQVPFHRPEEVLESPLPPSWWLAASVEAFWQHNKTILVDPEALALSPLLLGEEGLWCRVGEVAILLGSSGDRRWLQAAPLALVRRKWTGTPSAERRHLRVTDEPGPVPYRVLRDLALPPVRPSERFIPWGRLAAP